MAALSPTGQQTTAIPPLPLRTPIVDAQFNLTRPWIAFWQKVTDAVNLTSGFGDTAGTAKYQRTLLVKDTTVAANCADNVTIYIAGTAARLTGVLRKAIASALSITVRLNGDPLISATIPSTTAIDVVLTFVGFTTNPQPLPQEGVLSWDITASDGSKDPAGIAAFSLLWG